LRGQDRLHWLPGAFAFTARDFCPFSLIRCATRAIEAGQTERAERLIEAAYDSCDQLDFGLRLGS
jgi:hypothetical protein